MDIRRMFGLCLLFVGVALAVAAASAQEGGKAERVEAWEIRPPRRVRGLMRTLADPRWSKETDPVELPGHLFELEEAQEKQLQELARQREEERRELIGALDERYAEKVKEVLTDEERELYELVVAALKRFRVAVQAADDELTAVVGEEIAAGTRMLPRRTILHLVRFLELTREQKEELGRLQRSRAQAFAEAHKTIERPTDPKDRQDWKRYTEGLKKATGERDADFETQLKALLTPEQTERLSELEDALRKYQEQLKAAQETLTKELEGALGAGQLRTMWR